jgi:hypothetical protein
MAEQHGNRWYPTRYTIGHRKLLLDPNKTPMENLWNLISTCCGIWLAKFRVFAYERSVIEELEQEFRMRTFLRLRDHVWRGTYRKDLSLYLNTRSAAYGCCSDVLSTWKERNINRPAKWINIDRPFDADAKSVSDSTTLGDTLASHKVTKLRTKYDTICDCQRKCKGSKNLDEVERGQRGYGAVWHAVTESEWDYYLQSCDEFGLEPISKEEFLQKNFPPSKRTDRERKFAKAKWQSDYRSKQKEQGG